MTLKKFLRIFALSLSLFSVIFLGLTFARNKYIEYKYTPLRITYSIVAVGNASGIIIYADNDLILILTAFHVVDFAEDPLMIGVLYLDEHNEFVFEKFPILSLEIDPENDLALIAISPIKDMAYIKIVKENEEPMTGEDIFLAANPNLRFRSLKKGNLSSKFRVNSDDIRNWEVSGGVIFGSSGGGAFTTDGKLFGVIVGVDMLKTNFCKDKDGKQCLFIPITDTGFVVPPDTIREFVLNSSFGFCFDYLEE